MLLRVPSLRLSSGLLLQFILAPVLLPVQLLLQLPLPFLLHAASQSDSFPTTNLNPIPDPCHLPSPPSSASLSPFCQLHYHQISYICDPAGILSRTEAELIDRRLQSIPSPQASPLNVTGCLCDLPPASSPHRRQCAVHPAWKDKKLRQIRVVVLIAPQASIRSIKKCAKSTTDKKQQQQQNSGGSAEMAARRHQRQVPSHGFTSATAQFVHDTLNRLLSGEHPRERCDPDLLIIYILGWSTSGGQMPFVGRMFRRNLAHLAHESQVERIHTAETSPFEVLSEQLTRAAQLIIPSLGGRPPGGLTATAPPVSTEVLTQLSHHQQQFDPFSANPRTEQIPLWAILCSLALLSMALIAVLLAHWVGRRISAAHQVVGMAHIILFGARIPKRNCEISEERCAADGERLGEGRRIDSSRPRSWGSTEDQHVHRSFGYICDEFRSRRKGERGRRRQRRSPSDKRFDDVQTVQSKTPPVEDGWNGGTATEDLIRSTDAWS